MYVCMYVCIVYIYLFFAVATLFTRSGDHQTTDRLFNYTHN